MSLPSSRRSTAASLTERLPWSVGVSLVIGGTAADRPSDRRRSRAPGVSGGPDQAAEFGDAYRADLHGTAVRSGEFGLDGQVEAVELGAAVHEFKDGADGLEVDLPRYLDAFAVEDGAGGGGLVPDGFEEGVEAFVLLLPLDAGELVTCYLFSLRMSYSGKAVHRVFASCGQEAFFEGHVHALRTLGGVPRSKVDLPGRRLGPGGLNRPLDNYTAEAIGEYLAYRHRRWPNSANPHLLITRNTATTTTAVGTFWMDRLVKELPVGVDQLRQDRILEEAIANGADPLHLAHVFSPGAKAGLRYTSAVTESEAEQAPNTR
ncbi:hypothetical protein ACFC5Z_30845 [Streptomyces sp. NPDC056004]|uniref:hypothetical protein n=1 Tax=Streptomyces sp. NPDC056004 TaxID=3345677 RepID=UPI0035DBB17C